MTKKSVKNNLPRDEFGRILMTRESLTDGLQKAGLVEGDIVCAHVGMKALGYVCGAGQSVIDAILDVLGHSGTLMMPTFSGELSDPGTWQSPPVPEEWVELMRREMPAYDEHLTPTRGMGVVAELFRNRKGVIRSAHPHSSFAAMGLHASELTSAHLMNYRFGPASPLGRLAALNGKVLLLGAEINKASFVYLAQFCSGLGTEIIKSAPIVERGHSIWLDYLDIAVDNRLVGLGVERLLAIGCAKKTVIGGADVIIFDARPALCDLVNWFNCNEELFGPLPRESTPLPITWEDWLPRP